MANDLISRQAAIPIEWMVKKLTDKKIPWRHQRKFIYVLRTWEKEEYERLNQQTGGN